MMDSFPPSPERQVTLANWRSAPFNRWGIQHMREILPTASVDSDPERARTLPRCPCDLGGLVFTAPDGRARSLEGWLEESFADGLIVLHRGEIVTERYFGAMTPARPHLVFSVTKSVTALLVGVLAGRGALDPELPIVRYIPEAGGTGYGDATVRHALDMQVSLDYDEAHDDPTGMLARYREAAGWHPPRNPADPGDLRSFLLSLGRREGVHGRRFRYLTPNSDLLGWVCERAAGRPFAELLSQHLWQPMGAERAADIAVDRLGAARSGGGLAATLRDLARIAELVRCHGMAAERQVVPGAWIDDILSGGDAAAWAGNDFAYMLPEGGRYRSQWYLSDGRGSRFMAAGIHGQWIWGDRDAGVTIVKLASRPDPSVAAIDVIEMACFAAIAEAVAGREGA